MVGRSGFRTVRLVRFCTESVGRLNISPVLRSSVGEHAGAAHRGGDELEVDGAVMARQLIGIVGTAIGDRPHQLFVFTQGS